jgi:hypothetical protein
VSRTVVVSYHGCEELVFSSNGILSTFSKTIRVDEEDTTVRVSCFCYDPFESTILDYLSQKLVRIDQRPILSIIDDLTSVHLRDMKWNTIKPSVGCVMTRFNITVKKNGHRYIISSLWFIHVTRSNRPSQLERLDRFEVQHKELSSFFGVLNAIVSHRPTIPYSKSVMASIVRPCFENNDCTCNVKILLHLIDNKQESLEVWFTTSTNSIEFIGM